MNYRQLGTKEILVRFRVADVHVSQLSRENDEALGALWRARVAIDQDLLLRTICLTADGPCILCRTRHPFAASGSWPSQMIEYVFSASSETIRRESQELIFVAQSAMGRTWQSARFMIPVDFLPQRLLGHGSITTTMRYVHVAPGRVAAQGSPLDSLPLDPAQAA